MSIDLKGQSTGDFFMKPGRKVLGVNLNGGWGDERPVGKIFSRFGFFPAFKLQIGPEILFGDNGMEEYEFQGGIFIRYFFLPSKLSPYIEASYKAGFLSTNFARSERVNLFTDRVELTPGVNWVLYPNRISLDLLGTFLFVHQTKDLLFRPRVGVYYYL